MGDSSKVRLVRCPKCENLLPELADYSVYQCGGCGAVLRGTYFFLLLLTFSPLCFFTFDKLQNFLFCILNKVKVFLLGNIMEKIAFPFVALFHVFQSVFFIICFSSLSIKYFALKNKNMEKYVSDGSCRFTFNLQLRTKFM